MTLFIVDASHYQAGLPVESLQGQGFAAAIFKATEDVSWRDASFAGFLARAKAAGLPCAAYHFVHPGSAGAQAANIRATVPADVPVWLDCEAGANRDDGYAVADALRARGGLVAGIYHGAQPKTGYGGWWRAAYLSDPTGTAAATYARQGGDTGSGWDRGPDLWQFCQHGRIAGFSGDVDFSAFRGTLADLTGSGWFWTPTTALPREDTMLVIAATDNASRWAWNGTALRAVDLATLAALEKQGVQRIALSQAQVAALFPPQAPVDVQALAAALVPHLPPAVDPAAVAGQVAANLAARLQS